jgi:S1-C subfamily serine protease
MRAKIFLISIFLVVLTALSGCTFKSSEDPKKSPNLVKLEFPQGIDQASITPEVDSLDREIERSIVRVRNILCNNIMLGSGFAVDKNLIITNQHVIADYADLSVDSWNGSTFKIKSVKSFPAGDLALIETEKPLPNFLELDSGELDKGDVVQSIGFPGGGGYQVLTGIVLDFYTPEQIQDIWGRILVSNQVRPGNSGGPLINKQGQVTGIITEYDKISGNGLAIDSEKIGDLKQRSSKVPAASC